MNEMKPAGASPVDLSLGPLPEAAHSLRVGDAEYKDAWTAAQMHEERERCYALGVAAERERRAEPLRRLGARLASLLDEDQWAECEALLLQAGVGPNVANNLHAQARAGVK